VREDEPPLLLARVRIRDGSAAAIEVEGVASPLALIAGFEGEAARLLGAVGPVALEDAPRAPFVAALAAGGSQEVLLVNPVARAAAGAVAGLEPAREAAPPRRVPTPGGPLPGPTGPVNRPVYALGNPYDFYGSVGECATAYRDHCDACQTSGSCALLTRDGTSASDECAQLAADGGHGFVELCTNLALAILTVSRCVEDRAPACPQVRSAGDQLALLAANDAFLADPTCLGALDACLGEIYGEPSGSFPVVDGGIGGGGTPSPRSVDVTCTDCDSDTSCNFAPECDPKCDSTCEGGSCGDCSASSQTGGTSGSEGGDCGDCGGGTDSTGSSGSDCQFGGGDCGGDCGGGGCDCSSDSSSSSSSGSGGGCDCGGSGGSCQVARRHDLGRRLAIGASIAWSFVPLVVLALWNRRERRRRRQEVRA